MKRKLNYLFQLLLLSINIAISQTVTYSPTTEDFMNPDRGFYYATQALASNFTALDSADLVSKRTIPYTPWQAQYQVRSSMIFRYYVLDTFVNLDSISASFLNLIETDFIIARQAGVKMILRFAYTITADTSCNGFCTPYGDAPKARVLKHIEDLKPVLQNHADVISAVQMGFIGIWGEQYYTDHFGDASVQGKLFNVDWDNRNEVLAALLDAVPSNRMVQVRYPQLKQRFLFGPNAQVTTNPMLEGQAHDESDIARIGFHNDCFLSSPNDVGTYIDYGNDTTPSSDQTSILKAYAEADGKFVAVGGETCADGFDPENNCDGQAVSDMNSLHFSYLNAFYNNAVNNDWVTGGCMDEIKQKLGYRIEMIDGTYPGSAIQNTAFSFILNMENIGFAAPYNEREIQLILREVNTSAEYSIGLTGSMSDVRKWYTGAHTLQESITIPGNIPAGDYQLFLHILEPANNNNVANRPEYSIRLANSGTWESSTGYNNLQHTLTIIENNSVAACVNIDGDFSDWSNVPSISNPGSNGLTDFKVADDVTYIYGFIEGTIDDNYQLYVDSDNNNIDSNEYTNTNWFNTGLNYMIENGNIYQYTGTGLNWSWSFVGTADYNKNSSGLEIKIEKALLSGLSDDINLGFASLDINYTEVAHIPTSSSGSTYSLLSTIVDCECSNDSLLVTGPLSVDEHYKTNDIIQTSQMISGMVDIQYNSKISIELLSGFVTELNVTMHAYIEGCD